MKSYNPSKKVKQYLNYGMSLIKTLNYPPSERWLFYQLVQKYGLPKSASSTFTSWVSRARKRFYNGWHPAIMSDSIRSVTYSGDGKKDIVEWLEDKKEEYCYLDKISKQPNYVMIWFEARAMDGQFKEHTKDYYVSTVPFGGDLSIPIKWELAKHIEDIRQKYPEKKIIILYFGDCDKKGGMIPQSALKDIRAWCNVEFEFIRCGLTLEQAQKYRIPDNPDKPGQYQWEALNDADAKELIITNLEKYWSKELIDEVLKEEEKAEKLWKDTMTTIIDNTIGGESQ